MLIKLCRSILSKLTNTHNSSEKQDISLSFRNKSEYIKFRNWLLRELEELENLEKEK